MVIFLGLNLVTLDHGGLNLGTIGSSVFFLVILVVAVAIEARMEKRRLANGASS